MGPVAQRLGPPVFRPARAVLRTAHVATPPGQGGSHLGVQLKSGGGANGLERRLQPARGPQGRKARRATSPYGAQTPPRRNRDRNDMRGTPAIHQTGKSGMIYLDFRVE